MPPVGFELAISVRGKLQTYALDRAATDIGKSFMYPIINRNTFPFPICVRLILILFCMAFALVKSLAFLLSLLHIPSVVRLVVK